MKELVSIIMPNYNSASFIEESIASVLSQTYENWELILVDDYSTDGSVKIIKSLIADDKRVKLIKLAENSGPAIARNRAIEEAKGRYIAFLDSDDMWLPQKLEKQIQLLGKHNLVLTYSAYHTIDENSKYINTREVPAVITYEDFILDREKVIKQLRGAGISVNESFYEFKRSKQDILDFNKSSGSWFKYAYERHYAFGIGFFPGSNIKII